MSGKTPAEKIQSVFPNTRTLFISGYTADVIAHQGILEKGVHFLQKPFTYATLAEKIRELVKGEPGSGIR